MPQRKRNNLFEWMYEIYWVNKKVMLTRKRHLRLLRFE